MHKRIFLFLIIINFVLSAHCFENDSIYLTLNEVCELALSNNFDIQLAQLDAQVAGLGLDKAESIYDIILQADLEFQDDKNKTNSSFAGSKTEVRDYNVSLAKKLPTGTTLKTDFQDQRSWSDSPFVTTNPAHDTSVKLALSQELGKNLFGIKDRSNIKITKLDIENSEYTSLDRIEQMLSIVQVAYWKAAQFLKFVEIREDMLARAEELFQANKLKLSKGIIEKPQLLASEANLRQKEIDLILAQNELASSVNELKLLLNIGEKDKAILPAQGLDLDIQATSLNQLLEIAFRYRRDYLRARNDIDAKQIQLIMQKKNLWPEINLEASIIRNGLNQEFSSAAEGISSEDNPEYSLGISITLPLENRAAKSEFDKAKLEKAKALLNLKKTERQIFIQINDSLRNCNILEERARKQADVVNIQDEKLGAELKAYEYGRSDTDTIIRYQDDLLSSKLLYIQSLFDYKAALIELALNQNLLLNDFWKDRL